MNNQRSSAIAEQRMAVGAISKEHVIVSQLELGDALFVDAEVHHIAGVVPVGILKAVLFSVGIEVWTRGLEVWAIALGILMEVNAVSARRQVMQIKVKPYPRAFLAGPALHYRDRAHALALGIFNLDYSFGRAGERPENDRRRHSCNEKSFVFHGPDYNEATSGALFDHRHRRVVMVIGPYCCLRLARIFAFRVLRAPTTA
jgi:hypothetical protein